MDRFSLLLVAYALQSRAGLHAILAVRADRVKSHRAAETTRLDFAPRGEVAQLVEHTAENRGVAGSIPALATHSSHTSHHSDRCERCLRSGLITRERDVGLERLAWAFGG